MQRSFTVWLYIGVLLSVYGVMLTAAGVYQWMHPPHTVLVGKHATFWAGCILLIVGGSYTWGSWPRKLEEKPREGSQSVDRHG